MRKNSFFGAAIIAVFLCLIQGCSTFETLGDYVSENPLIAQVATRQAVAQYIAEGDSLEEEIARAQSVKNRIKKVLIFLDGDPEAKVSDLMVVINDSIEWDELTFRDRLLVQDIVKLVEDELEEAVEIDDSVRVVLSVMLETAISAAQIYINR